MLIHSVWNYIFVPRPNKQIHDKTAAPADDSRGVSALTGCSALHGSVTRCRHDRLLTLLDIFQAPVSHLQALGSLLWKVHTQLSSLAGVSANLPLIWCFCQWFPKTVDEKNRGYNHVVREIMTEGLTNLSSRISEGCGGNPHLEALAEH